MTPAQTPERPVSWTDEEIVHAYQMTRGFSSLGVEGRAFLSALGAVHPAEVREREREAWKQGRRSEARRWYDHRMAPEREIAAELDRLYPSLLPASPPPLVLSSGRWVRNEIGKYWACNNVSWNYPHVNTASDAEALAKWLREWGSTEEAK